jgi:hypothetical protein
VQVPGHQYDDREHDSQNGQLGQGVVVDRLCPQDQAGYQGYRQ